MPPAMTREAVTNGEVAGRVPLGKGKKIPKGEVRSSTERRRIVDNPRVRRVGSSRSGASDESTKEKAKQQSQEVAQRAQQQASEVAEQGSQQAKSQIATQKERAAGQLEGVAQALHQTGQQLREQDQGPIGRYADKAAEQVERFSGFLRERDANELIGEAESLARSRPTVFLGGAFVLGLAAARFLKSSSSSGNGGASGGSFGSSYGNDSYASAGSGTSYEGGTGRTAIEEDRELDREGDLSRRTRAREE